MKHILAHANRAVLEQLAWSNVLLGFDFDGTLCPIVARPDDARLGTTTRRLLEELSALYPCVVISGRSLADVRARLAPLELAGEIGNHGLEPSRATEDMRRTVERWRKALASKLASLQGVLIEDKAYSLAVHYRRSRAKQRAREAISEAIATLGRVRVIGGKQVVNVLPFGAPHKGVALERERVRLGCDTAFFVGDDETDEDVFALERPGRLVTVRIGPRPGSLASYCLRSQREIDGLLRALIDLRLAAPRRAIARG